MAFGQAFAGQRVLCSLRRLLAVDYVSFKEFHQLMITGLSPISTEQSLENYYSKYGTVRDVILRRDQRSLRSRNHAYIKYALFEEVYDLYLFYLFG